MNKSQFIQAIEGLDVYYCKINPEPKQGNSPQGQSLGRNKLDLDYYLYCDWSGGGTHGGSCWGGTPCYHTEGDQESKSLEKDLKLIVEAANPNFTYLKYLELLENVKYGDCGYTDYYGNTSRTNYKYLSLKDIYIALTK